jgi:hypothetical protein
MAENRDAARARLGRYEAVGSASSSGPLPREGRRGRQITIRHGAVDDPDETVSGQRRRVAINTRTDPLEHEYSRGRLSEAAYRTGRTYQCVIERASGLRTLSSWRDGVRVDVGISGDKAIVLALDRASQAVRVRDEVRPIIGLLGERILALTLGDGLTFTETAERLGGCGGEPSARRHAASFYAWTFRQSLEILAAEWRP